MNDILRRPTDQTAASPTRRSPEPSAGQGRAIDGSNRIVEIGSGEIKNHLQASASPHQQVRGHTADQPVLRGHSAGDHQNVVGNKRRADTDGKPLRFDSFSALSRHLSET